MAGGSPLFSKDQLMSDNETVRFNVQLPKELNDTLLRHIPWGLKNNIMIALATKLGETLEKDGKLAMVDILEDKFEIKCTGAAKDSN